MVMTLLLISTWPFWLLLLAFLCLEVYFLEHEEPIKTTMSLAIFVGLVLMFTDWKPWHTFSWESAIGYGLLYLVLGVAYVFPRFILYTSDKVKDFDSSYDEYKTRWNNRNTETNPKWPQDGARWSNFATFEDMLRGERKMPPMPWDQGVKGKVYMWMAYWPLSGAWVLLHRPLEWFWDWAYATVKDKLASLSYKIFRSHFRGR